MFNLGLRAYQGILYLNIILLYIYIYSSDSCKAGVSKQYSHQPYFNKKILLF
jgi:hypothetical protein